jgi:DNA-binding NarL/FixJ family response regulator
VCAALALLRRSRRISPGPAHSPQTKRGRSFFGVNVSKQEEHEAALLRGLSPREREVLVLVVEGRTSREIAQVIGVQPSTVDTYRSRIMAKLGIEDLPSLVRFAVRHGLIKP